MLQGVLGQSAALGENLFALEKVGPDLAEVIEENCAVLFLEVGARVEHRVDVFHFLQVGENVLVLGDVESLGGVVLFVHGQHCDLQVRNVLEQLLVALVFVRGDAFS